MTTRRKSNRSKRLLTRKKHKMGTRKNTRSKRKSYKKGSKKSFRAGTSRTKRTTRKSRVKRGGQSPDVERRKSAWNVLKKAVQRVQSGKKRNSLQPSYSSELRRNSLYKPASSTPSSLSRPGTLGRRDSSSRTGTIKRTSEIRPDFDHEWSSFGGWVQQYVGEKRTIEV